MAKQSVMPWAVPYEFMPRDAFRCEGMTGYGTHNQPIGTWSDDTSMMLATLDSLIANEWQVNTEDMGERYLAWLSNGEYAIDGRVLRLRANGLRRVAAACGLKR